MACAESRNLRSRLKNKKGTDQKQVRTSTFCAKNRYTHFSWPNTHHLDPSLLGAAEQFTPIQPLQSSWTHERHCARLSGPKSVALGAKSHESLCFSSLAAAFIRCSVHANIQRMHMRCSKNPLHAVHNACMHHAALQ